MRNRSKDRKRETDQVQPAGFIRGSLGFLLVAFAVGFVSAPVLAQDLEIASTNESGQIVSGVAAERPFISSSGRYVVFLARNLMASAGTTEQVYLRDLWTDQLELISVNTSGGGTTGAVDLPFEVTARVIDTAGRYVAFRSSGNDLVPGIDPGSLMHVFLRDRTLGTTTLVSRATDGTPANGSSSYYTVAPAGSAPGHAVVMFNSTATNLDALDPTSDVDTFHYSTILDMTRLACFDLFGDTIVGGCGSGFSIMDAGAMIAIRTNSNSLVAGDSAGSDIFVGLPFFGDAWAIQTADTFGMQTVGAVHSLPSINASGSRIVFATTTSIFPLTDPPNTEDIYVKSVISGEIFPLTLGGPVNPVFRSVPSLSPGGAWVVLDTTTSFDPIDTGASRDIYVMDFTDDIVRPFELVSQNMGVAGNNSSVSGVVSSYGDVAFVSSSNNLAPIPDTNSNPDVFVSLPEPGLAVSLGVSVLVAAVHRRRRRISA